jgi:hypothetical protein
MHDLPILIIFFNRPRVLEANLRGLAKFKPNKIYLAIDGPRKTSDIKLVKQCISIAFKIISWECEIFFYESKVNYGCDNFVPKAIDWLFSQETEGIILEDDCIISEDFYSFASILLERYKDNQQIMNISAANFQNRKWGGADYYFSRYPSNWAWATWARAWEKFDPEMKEWNRRGHSWLSNLLKDKRQYKYWVHFFNGLVSKKYTYWDAKWVYSIWISGGLSITPNFNLVSNIGFGKDATHTKSISKGMAALIDKVDLPLKHPDLGFDVSHEADKFLYETRYKPTTIGYIRHFLRKIGQYVT